jgi:hypothetical protein
MKRAPGPGCNAILSWFLKASIFRRVRTERSEECIVMAEVLKGKSIVNREKFIFRIQRNGLVDAR